MPAQDMAVCPPTMMNAASKAAADMEAAGTLPTGAAPMVAPGSPMDGAGVTVAGAMETEVAAASTTWSYKAPYVYGATQDGVLRTVTNDEQQAQHIRSVAEGAQAGPGAGPGVPPSLIGGTPRVERPVYPLNPNGAMPGPSATEYAPVSAASGAAAGPNAGPGVPPSLIGGTPRVERPVYPLNPNGAMPGPSATEYAPVSAASGAAAGPNAGPGVPPSLVGGTPRVERPVYPLNPNGAMPGPSATEYAPVAFTESGTPHIEV